MSNIQQLEKFLDYCSLKNRVITKNIANATTANYKSQDVSFDNILNENMNSVLKKTSEKHIASNPNSTNSPVITKSENTNGFVVASDGNNVDMEKEMAELARNTLNYKFASKKIGNYYKTLQGVIRGRS